MSDHVFVAGNVLLLSFILIMTIILGQIIDNFKIKFIPHSVAAIALGGIIGIVIYLTSKKETEFFMFNDSLFFFALLPPIVFDAGYAMKRTNFFRNMWTILMYAFIGTIISTFAIGYGIWGLAKAGAIDVDSSSPVDALIFGALISSIDPVATLAILGNKALNVPPLLYSLVFGESVLNDAIAITLFDTFKEFHKEKFTSISAVKAIGVFIGIAIGSVLMGAACALISSAILRRLNFMKKPSNEFVIILFFAYGSYCLAEVSHLSGIISLFSCGVLQAHYAWYNISNVSRTTTRHAFHSFAHIAESFLYTYLGITAVLSSTETTGYKWSWKLTLFSMILLFISRALNIFPLSFIANLRRKTKIPFKMQVLIWFSGLRGAISFALALRMDSPDPNYSKYITTTMAIIILTTVFMGGLSNWFLGCLGLTNPTSSDRDTTSKIGGDGTTIVIRGADQFMPLEDQQADTRDVHSMAYSHRETRADSSVGVTPSELRLTGKERTNAIVERRLAESRGHVESGSEQLSRLHEWWIRFDITFMQPWFGGRHAPKMEGAENDGEDNSQMPNPYLAQLVPESAHIYDAEVKAIEDEVAEEIERNSIVLSRLPSNATQSLLANTSYQNEDLGHVAVLGDSSPIESSGSNRPFGHAVTQSVARED